MSTHEEVKGKLNTINLLSQTILYFLSAFSYFRSNLISFRCFTCLSPYLEAKCHNTLTTDVAFLRKWTRTILQNHKSLFVCFCGCWITIGNLKGSIPFIYYSFQFTFWSTFYLNKPNFTIWQLRSVKILWNH